MTNDVAGWRRATRMLVRILLGLLAFEAIAVVVYRSKWQPAIDVGRRFNKKVLNPAMSKVAGRRNWYAAAVHHTGRRSGREYTTPVWAERVGQSFFVPLPYGTDVDWCRNVLAGGGCVIEDDGLRYDTLAPAVVAAVEVGPQLPPGHRRTFGLLGVESYLRLNIVPSDRPAAETG